ncbi:MAG: chromosome segregation protein SMC [Bacillota bacterium]|nr:chromosome segregation protein SMC [Bacillota bacterium]
MFLKRIELQGFKSFADKTIIQFEQDITGIVGPNGCGKSNVNDAIRWVLGEQSVKSLRSGTSMSDIIFSGSEYRKPVNMAKVTLVFDNTEHIFDSEFEELEITRQLQRSTNEASYFINKTPCRLKDINELIMDTGLGRDSLSIITQGNISSFADAKPEDRRSLFEEAAGVSKYKKRKKVSLQKLEQTQDNLNRLQDILDEIERQLGPLEKQAKKAEKFVELRDQLAKIEISVLVEEVDSLQNKVQELQKELLENQALYTSKEATMNQQDLESDSLRKEMYALDKQINELQAKYTKAMEDSYKLEKRKIEMDEKRKYALAQANRQERLAQLKQIVSEAKFEYEDRKDRLNKKRVELKLHSQNLESLKAKENRAHYETGQAQSIYQTLLNRKQVLENMAKAPYTHQQGVKAVMSAKQSLPGIEGTISELLSAHDNMAMAINSALGGAIYNIVARDEEAARYAINFLKRNRSGRATFLPMSVCKARYANETQDTIARNTRGFICWAHEAVDFDAKYNDVVARLLGNIAIVDNLENANECAKRLRYQVKIVTLDGDIVHSGGSMTGGHNKSQGSPFTMKQELETIEAQIEGQKFKVQTALEEERAYQKRMQDESDQIVQIRIELAKLENIFAAKKEKYDSLMDEYKQLAPDEQQEDTKMEEDEIVVQMSKMHAYVDELTASIQTLRQKRFDVGNEVEKMENQVRLIRREISSLQGDIHRIEMDLVKIKTRQENALMRLNSDYQMTYEFALTKKEDIDIEQAKDEVVQLRQAIHKLGNVNLDAPQEFEELKERFDFMSHQKEDLESASEQIRGAIAEMDETMKTQFSDMFHKINSELDGVIKAMFGGGKAKLSMVDPDDILNTGIDIDVQPPGKLVKNISSFSGGEKALIAISVLFAILKARRMPLCIFDEVEAALDQANVERFAKYLSHYRGQSQFIVVTHRPGTMEQCDTLYGVTMQKDGVSKVLMVKLQDALSITGEEEEK